VTAGTAPGFSATADVNTNRLTTGYGYDLNGNMTNDGSNTIAYDAENRAITSSGGLRSGTYTYDGNNLRVKKVAGSTTTVYIFSGASVIAEYVNGVAPASPTREYVYSGSTLLAKIESSATQYYHADHLSARLMTDSSGTKIGEQGHYSFGESWYLTSATTKWQFTSYERDSESGNDYARARMYVSRLGRFSALDPIAGSIGDPQSLDRYSYVRNDPTNLVDPLGMDESLTCSQGGGLDDGTGGAGSGVCQGNSTVVAIITYEGIGSFGCTDQGCIQVDAPQTVTVNSGGLDTSSTDVDGGGMLDGDVMGGGIGMPQGENIAKLIEKLTGGPKFPCPPIPKHSQSMDVNANIAKAEEHRDYVGTGAGSLWFYNQVKNGGPWDYKLQPPKGAYDDFGNFNYGATGTAVGFSPGTLLRAAGAKKWWESSGAPYGKPWGDYPYGNQTDKQEWIQDGINYYNEKKKGCVDPK